MAAQRPNAVDAPQLPPLQSDMMAAVAAATVAAMQSVQRQSQPPQHGRGYAKSWDEVEDAGSFCCCCFNCISGWCLFFFWMAIAFIIMQLVLSQGDELFLSVTAKNAKGSPPAFTPVPPLGRIR